jgi:predicted Fe-S protein YdhL (DUF1289 family)
MSETSRNKFISQCVAQTPCVGKDSVHCKMNDKGTFCSTCKRSLLEIQMWGETSFEDREKICKELLDR